MRNFRKACAAALLVFTLSATTLAGDGWIGTGYTQPPPPPPAAATFSDDVQTQAAPIELQTPYEGEGVLAELMGVALSMFGGIQTLF
jgi:hypothetical protein